MNGFIPQFVERFLNPLLKRIMTDMADPPEDKKYLGRFTLGLQSQKLQPLEREKFLSDYFREDKTKPFSTTEKEDVDFQNEFLDTFIQFFDLYKNLSGVDGVRKLYFPQNEKEKEKKFSEAAEKNIYRFAYKLCLTFEKKRIEELVKGEKGEVTLKDKENILSGQVKLIIVDGVQRYITEKEAIIAGQNPTTNKIKIQTFSGDEKTLGDLSTSFNEAKAMSIEMALEENGLEIFEPIQLDPQNPQKFAKGIVKDVSGQKLAVTIDLQALPEDPRKIVFLFLESPEGKTERKGEIFTSNLNDLKRFQSNTGERKTAEEVAHPELAKIAKEGQLAGMEPLLLPMNFGKLPLEGSGKRKTEISENEPESFHIKLEVKAKTKLDEKEKMALSTTLRNAQFSTLQQRGLKLHSSNKQNQIPSNTLINETVSAKKKTVMEAKAESPGNISPPVSPFLQKPQETNLQQTTRKKKKGGVGRWVVAAHIGTFGGIVGGGIWSAISSDSDTTKKVIVMVLKTIGLA